MNRPSLKSYGVEPEGEYRWFPITVRIRRNSDAATRTYLAWDTDKKFRPEDDDGWSGYIWSEGNYSCDCNRASFFAEAGGDVDDGDRPCGETRYTILSIVDDRTGETIYEERD